MYGMKIENDIINNFTIKDVKDYFILCFGNNKCGNYYSSSNIYLIEEYCEAKNIYNFNCDKVFRYYPGIGIIERFFGMDIGYFYHFYPQNNENKNDSINYYEFLLNYLKSNNK